MSNILVIGGSKNIGYYAAVRFLAKGSNVTFLLRSPNVFDKDTVIQEHIKSGKAHLVKGDGLVESDVKRAWDEAGRTGPVDLLLFTVGGTPSFHPLKGAVITPANLVTQCFANVLCTMPKEDPQPKIIAISSTGLTKTSHASLPLVLKPVYGYLLTLPHKDKVGVEYLASHAAGWKWNTEKDGEPGVDIMGGANWREREGMPAKGSLKKLLIIRPALLTDGECKAEMKGGKKYRVSEGELGGYTVSRKDVAHFVVEAATERWQEFENKRVNVGY